MACLINYDNTDIRYLSSQSNRWKTEDAGVTFTPIDPPAGTGDTISDIWWSDWIMDPNDPDLLFMAEHDVYRTTDGGVNWSLMLPFGSSQRVMALAQGVDDPEVLYAARETQIRKTDNAITGSPPSWSIVSGSLPVSSARMVTSIAIDPDFSNRVWVTLAGYSSGMKVYFTPDSGTSWINVSDNLPNVPANKIVYQPGSNDGLYVGTDIGIFYTDNDITGWIYFTNGLPSTPVFDLVIEGGNIYAGTFGRGIWKSSVFSSCAVAYVLTTGNDPSNPNSTGVQRYEALIIHHFYPSDCWWHRYRRHIYV